MVFAVLLGQATANGNLHGGVRLFDLPQLAEVSVEFVVRVLTDSARVEHHHIRHLPVSGHVAGFFEKSSHAL